MATAAVIPAITIANFPNAIVAADAFAVATENRFPMDSRNPTLPPLSLLIAYSALNSATNPSTAVTIPLIPSFANTDVEFLQIM